jgi:hypothetical protein
MQNLTSALAVSSPYLPSTGLKQSMLNLSTTFSPMKLQCREGFRESPRSIKAAKYFIFTTIRSMHEDAINRIVDEGQLDDHFQMPTFEVIHPEKMEVHLLGAIFKDEGTIAGTQEVHNEIFLNKLRMVKDPATTGDTSSSHLPAEPVDEFQTRLFIVHGDEKTSSLIRSVKYNNRNSRRAFDRRQWLICAPGMFHVLQACMLSIVRTHWDSDGTLSRTTITHDIGYFDRRGISQSNARFHEVEPLLQQGFAARVLAMFYSFLRREGFLQEHTDSNSTTQRQRYDAAVTRLSPRQLVNAVDWIYNTAFTKAAWDGVGVKDREFVSMCRYLQEILYFQELRYAVRHGDIGLIDFLIDPLLLIFCGAGQHKYSFELLHFRWLLCASSPELRRSLLASMLINETGNAGSFKATDLALELVNARYARTIKVHKNSRHELMHMFHRLSLVQTEIRSINSRLQTDYGRLVSNKHVFRRAQADIFSLACFLEAHAAATPRVDPPSLSQLFESPSVTEVGMLKIDELFTRLQDAVAALNENASDFDAESQPGNGDSTVDDDAHPLFGSEELRGDDRVLYADAIEDACGDDNLEPLVSAMYEGEDDALASFLDA